jgi:hypothetical protein
MLWEVGETKRRGREADEERGGRWEVGGVSREMVVW